jgi:hypothetical protein
MQHTRLATTTTALSRAAACGDQRVERRVVRRGSAQQVGPQHSCAHRVHGMGSAQELLWAAAQLQCIAAGAAPPRQHAALAATHATWRALHMGICTVTGESA